MRKCLLIFDAQDGGVPEHVMRLALGLPERGWAPWIAGPEWASIYEQLRRTRLPITRLPFQAGYSHPVDDACALHGLIHLMRSHQFDLVHAHSPKAGALGRLVAFGFGIPTIFTAHGFAFNPAVRGRPGRDVSLFLERILAPRTDAIICVSDAVRRLALERRLAPPTALHTVRNGAAGSELQLEPDPELERFVSGGPSAGCVTVLGPGKRVDIFIEAARRVLARVADARLAVVGNGVLRGQLERQARSLGLGGQLRFFDYRGPSARQLRSLDVFVSPSPWEAMPIAPLEAMACGVPQIAVNTGGTPEVVSDGVTGLLCQPNDPAGLAEAITRLLSSPALRQRMSVASRDRQRRLFTVQRMVDETAAVLDLVVAASETPVPMPHRKPARSIA